jgi:hypothetical protein
MVRAWHDRKFSIGIFYNNKVYPHLYNFDKIKGLSSMKFDLPSKSWIDQYEKEKDNYLKETLPTWRKEIMAFKGKEESRLERHTKKHDPFLPSWEQ